MRGHLVLMVGLLTGGAHAAEAEGDWGLGTSTPSSVVKVERRLLVKHQRLFILAGPSYLARGDYFESPGVSAAASYYLTPHDGLELRLSYFFSFLNSGGAEVARTTGLVPDAHRTVAQASAGWRRGLGYGKLLLERATPTVLHFDLQLWVSGGLALTDKGVGPVLAAGPALMVRIADRWVLQLELAAQGSLEARRQLTLAGGLLTSLTLGASL